MSDEEEDFEHQREQAAGQVQEMIDELEACHRAALLVREGIKTNSPTVISEGLRKLADYTDGHWYRLVIGKGTGEIAELARLINLRQVAEAGLL